MVIVSAIICLFVQCFLVLRVWKCKSFSLFLTLLPPGIAHITNFSLCLWCSSFRAVSHKSIPTVTILMLLVIGEFVSVLSEFCSVDHIWFNH